MLRLAFIWMLIATKKWTFMKLELLKKFKPVNQVLTSTSLNNDTVVLLSYNNENNYELSLLSKEEYKILDLGITESYFSIDNPVLYSIDNHFGIIKNTNELLIYSNEKFETIEIKNSQVLPERVRLCYPSPVSNTNILPICFESDGFIGIPRYIAFLKIDIINKQANWEHWTSLETKSFAHHDEAKYPPKIDSVILKNNELYIFTSGGKITSVNKWGMDYYAFVKSNKKGVVIDFLLDSGSLHSIDDKKRGVNGQFSSSGKYLMLTPVFQSDEWKGKQKIFSLELNEIFDITFPQGFGKYPQVIQHLGDYFWVYLRDSKEIAICLKK